jgi:hypothetical protein
METEIKSAIELYRKASEQTDQESPELEDEEGQK